MILPFSPNHILLKGSPAHLISGRSGGVQEFQTRYLCILDRTLDFNMYQDKYKTK